MELVVNKDGIRLDKYLSEELDITRSKVQKIIKNGNVRNDNKVLNNNYIVSIGEKLNIELEVERNNDIKCTDIELDIVYEDKYLLIINKQSGLVVHPAPGHHDDTLVNALVNRYKLSNVDSLRPGIVHRIDKDTSGLMIVAKDDKIHELLSEMIKNKKIERIYWALVEGVINHDTGTIDAPIGRDPNNRQKMTVTDKNSKEAITHFKVLKRFNSKTLVECKLETGRTHQIRVHFKYINHPVVGDPVYGKKIKDSEFGQFLHSKKITFIHPITKNKLSFESDLPNEFNNYLNSLI